MAEVLPRLRRYAIGLAGDVSTADDLVQDCMERAWKNRGTLKDDGAIFGWLRAILNNVNIDRVLFNAGRAVGVVATDGTTYGAAEVILSGGTYGSPAILLRSGVGPAAVTKCRAARSLSSEDQPSRSA